MAEPAPSGAAGNGRGKKVGRGKETMTPWREGLLEELYRRMEEEILHYHLLGEELKKESGFLRQGSLDLLTESLHSVEMHVEEIRRAHGSIARDIEKMVSTLRPEEKEKTLGTLLTLLPAKEAQRIKGYQRTLASLKKRTSQVNTRNRTFVQGSLAYWRELFSLLTQPLAESPVYIQNGKTQSSTLLPISLNRKV
jgi:flagellar biosynthesis/type III secretory pathway chaperone